MTDLVRTANHRRTRSRLIALLAFVLHGICLPAHLAQHEHLAPDAHGNAHTGLGRSLVSHHHRGHHPAHSVLDHASGPMVGRKSAQPITIDLLPIAVATPWTPENRIARDTSDRLDSRRSRQICPIPFPRGPPATV